MSVSRLTQQVESYHLWKHNLIREIERYSSWLEASQLHSDDLKRKLHRSLDLLRDDELTIAFVGEYSRGKTELINALIFADFGQRMLPSQAGRTTMCPTELFYDQESQANYLRLLPIETRTSEKSLSEFRQNREHWIHYPLDISSPEAMKASLAEVSRTKSVPVEEARALGFQDEALDYDPENSHHVIIPAWRHALISLQNPLLERGLRILDTPGLNALGSEPELTISMIPNAHAVIFLLSVDTGVTASDLAIWNNFIATTDSDHRAGRFAVLNKIDMLWDDIQGEQHTQEAISQVHRKTAELLGLKREEVMLVSAKQALTGKVRDDKNLLSRSRLPELEDLISKRILAQKERLLTHTLVADILGMLQNSQAILQGRVELLKERLEELSARGVSKEFLKELTERTQEDYDYYYKKLITLRSSRRLMQSQARILDNLFRPERFDEHTQRARQQLMSSWTTLGMYRTMGSFFDTLEDDIAHLVHEAKLAQKMVASIYGRYSSDTRTRHLKPPVFKIERQIRDLKILREQAAKFQRNPKTLMTEQTLVIKQFFSTLVNEARKLHGAIRKECERWPQEALLPIMQHTLEQKQMLEHQIRRLKELARTAKDTRSQTRKLEQLIQETEKQMFMAEQIQRRIRKPAPALRAQKVVNLTGLTG